MRLKKEEIEKLASLILRNLREGRLITKKETEQEIQLKIGGVLLQNMEQEVAIEEQVKKIMEQYKAQIASGAIDPQKIYMMIKKQVAKEKNFIL